MRKTACRTASACALRVRHARESCSSHCREAHAPLEFREARIRTQPIPTRIEAQPDEPVRPFVKCFVERCEGGIILAEAGMNERDAVGRYEFLTRQLLQLRENLGRGHRRRR